MAVTQGLGDGFALYNGVKLPNIESVWTEELKAEKPYAIVASLEGITFLQLSSASTYVKSNHVAFPVGTSFSLYLFDGEWIKEQESVSDTEISAVPSSGIIWSNNDTLNEDGSIYMEATSPIPLDGMQVIEWDGDTSGLEVDSVAGLVNIRPDLRLSQAEMDTAICGVRGQISGEDAWFESTDTEGDILVGQDDPDNPVYTLFRPICIHLVESGESFDTYAPLAMSSAITRDTMPGFSAAAIGDGASYVFAYTPAAEPETPKWQFNLRDFLSGMVSAAASRGVLKRTPIAYLYNGVQLPGLPEWDRETYPYVCLTRTTISAVGLDVYYLRCSDVMATYSEQAQYETAANTYTFSCNAANPTAWSDTGEDTKSAGYVFGNPIWTNHDIVCADGAIYLAASNSVPVYE